MRTVLLSEIAAVFNGKTPNKLEQRTSGHPVLKIKDLDPLGFFRGSFASFVDNDLAVKYRTKWARVGDTVILNAAHNVSHVASKAAMLGPEVEDAMLTGEWLVVRTGEGTDARYVHYWLTSKVVRAALKDSVKGIHLYPRDVAALRIPLPPVEDQRRIATILNQADALRTKRRQVLAHLHSLTQSIFYEMFGDPIEGHWDRVPLGELVSRIDSGWSPNCEARPAADDEWGVLKLGAVTYGTFQPTENKAFLGPVGAMASNEVNAGDVLLTRKNTRQLVGAVAIVESVRPRLLIPDLIFRLHIDRVRVEPRYFQALMMNPRKRSAVQDLSSGSASSMPNISKGRLAGLPIELPPLAQQNDFSGRLDYLRAQQCVAEKALVGANELFDSLQSRVFQDGLDRRPSR